MWFRSSYMFLRLSMKMSVFVVSVSKCSIASRSTYSSTLKIFVNIINAGDIRDRTQVVG
jgi:hypothetical protein